MSPPDPRPTRARAALRRLRALLAHWLFGEGWSRFRCRRCGNPWNACPCDGDGRGGPRR